MKHADEPSESYGQAGIPGPVQIPAHLEIAQLRLDLEARTQERDEARQQASVYHRRAQQAEAALVEKIGDSRSIGRSLANAGYHHWKERAEAAERFKAEACAYIEERLLVHAPSAVAHHATGTRLITQLVDRLEARAEAAEQERDKAIDDFETEQRRWAEADRKWSDAVDRATSAEARVTQLRAALEKVIGYASSYADVLTYPLSPTDRVEYLAAMKAAEDVLK